MGLLDYPVLMASDILLYQVAIAAVVAVAVAVAVAVVSWPPTSCSTR